MGCSSDVGWTASPTGIPLNFLPDEVWYNDDREG
jgi:hypothetical protein